MQQCSPASSTAAVWQQACQPPAAGAAQAGHRLLHQALVWAWSGNAHSISCSTSVQQRHQRSGVTECSAGMLQRSRAVQATRAVKFLAYGQQQHGWRQKHAAGLLCSSGVLTGSDGVVPLPFSLLAAPAVHPQWGAGGLHACNPSTTCRRRSVMA